MVRIKIAGVLFLLLCVILQIGILQASDEKNVPPQTAAEPPLACASLKTCAVAAIPGLDDPLSPAEIVAQSVVGSCAKETLECKGDLSKESIAKAQKEVPAGKSDQQIKDHVNSPEFQQGLDESVTNLVTPLVLEYRAPQTNQGK